MVRLLPSDSWAPQRDNAGNGPNYANVGIRVSAVGTDNREPNDLDDRRPERRYRDDYEDRPDYERPHRGGMILAFGIISLVACQFGIGIIFGILAWVMGNSDLKGIESGEVDPEGRQLTQVGKILGIVGTALSGVYMIVMGIYLAFIFAVIARAPMPAPVRPPAPMPAPQPPLPPMKGALVSPAVF